MFIRIHFVGGTRGFSMHSHRVIEAGHQELYVTEHIHWFEGDDRGTLQVMVKNHSWRLNPVITSQSTCLLTKSLFHPDVSVKGLLLDRGTSQRMVICFFAASFLAVQTGENLLSFSNSQIMLSRFSNILISRALTFQTCIFPLKQLA